MFAVVKQVQFDKEALYFYLKAARFYKKSMRVLLF